MAVSVNDSKGLGKALKDNEGEIIIEGDLKNKVLRIKATGKVAWAVAIGAIGVAVVSAIAAPATGGDSIIFSSASSCISFRRSYNYCCYWNCCYSRWSWSIK